MANSCLMSQFFMSCAMPCFLYSQTYMIYTLSSCMCASLAVASCISCIDAHTGRPTVAFILLIFIIRPHISLSLLSSWLWCDNLSVINSSGPGVCSMYILYWCIHRIMHCWHCDSVERSLPIVATNGLCSMTTCTSCAKEKKLVEFLQPVQNSECLPFDIAVSLLHARYVLSCKSNGPEHCTVWCCIILTI